MLTSRRTSQWQTRRNLLLEINTDEAEAVVVSKVIGHHVFGGAKPGSLENVYVRVLYSDGSSSGRDYVPAAPLEGSACLAAYIKLKNGQKIAKYMPRSV